MKFTKLSAALLAATTAIVPIPSDTTAFLAPSAVFAADAGAVTTLPDWIPNDLESAVAFRNTYGATHIQDGLICVVYKLQRDVVPDGEPQGMLRYELQVTDNTVKLLRHTSFGSENTGYYYEIAVFQPRQTSDFDIVMTDTWVDETDPDLEFGHAIARYSFSAKNEEDITETDIYGWLPDCNEEYGDYARENGDVSVKDNYIVFCLTSVPQFGDSWSPDSSVKLTHTKLAASSTCTIESAEIYDGGAISMVYAYQAVQDGYEKISWIRTSGVRPDQQDPTPLTLTADCVILDQAQTVLLPDDGRVTLLDDSTEEQIPVDADSGYALYEITNRLGVTPIIAELDSNPCILRNLSHPLDESVGLKTPGIYIVGTDLASAAPFSFTKYDNGAVDAVFRLQKREMLPDGATRITLYDKDTGELIPSEILEHHMWKFGTDIRLHDGVTGPIYIVTSNPQIYNTDLASLYKNAEYFAFLCDDQPEITYYANNSMDLVFRTKVKVSGDLNGDGAFDISDLELLEEWLTGHCDEEIFRWAEADFNLDNKLNAVDVSMMKRALIQAENAPTAVSVREGGGVVGTDVLYKVYSENGNYYLCYHDITNNRDAEPWNARITESEYREIISLDYDSMIQNMIVDGPEFSEIQFVLELAFADGSKKTVASVRMPDVLTKLRALKEKYIPFVIPDELSYWPELYVISHDLKLYLGPDESYPVIASIPHASILNEAGYENNNDQWIFTTYDGEYGWIKLYEEDGTRTVDYIQQPAKPVIYLYPEQETDVHVELELTEADLHTTYPKYNNGWDVTAYPDGTLVNRADGSRHRYLFWDAVNCRTRFDFSTGFCVAGSDTERFLKEKLTYMGLTEDEMNEFIVYWLPLMEHNAYNLISFQDEAYTNSAKLTVTPTPDSECRIFMAYIPLEEAVEIEPQQLETFERTGFAVVEWGGVEIRR